MAHINKVLISYETDDGRRCVDIFHRPDGSYGFEEYRRDPEDGRGWHPAGGFDMLQFPTRTACEAAARESVGWLD